MKTSFRAKHTPIMSAHRIPLCLLIAYQLVLLPNVAIANTIKRSPVESANYSASLRSPAPSPTPTPNLTDAAISIRKPTLNTGTIDGNLRVITGEAFNVNGGFQLKSDIYVAGTPTIVKNGSSYGGIIIENGPATPTYQIILNGVQIPGKFHTRSTPVQLPADIPSTVPSPSGTRVVNINSTADLNAIGNWATVKDLNVNKSGVVIDVPPGNYGAFTMNGTATLKFTAGTYNFNGTLNVNGGSTIESTGRITINLKQNLNVNHGFFTVGQFTSPGDVKLNILGSSFNINGPSQINALVRAKNATASLNGNGIIRGQIIANYLNVNAGTITGAAWPAYTSDGWNIYGPRRFERTTGPSNTYTEEFTLPAGIYPPFMVKVQNGAGNGSARVTEATIKVNGATVCSPSELNQNTATLEHPVTLNTNNTIEVTVNGTPGSYLIITITGSNAPSDTTEPNIDITSPTNNFTTTAATINVNGTAGDAGGIATITVNDNATAYNADAGTWAYDNLPLGLGPNQIIVKAVDFSGNQQTVQITVVREASAQDTVAPSLSISSPANNSNTTDATINISGTVTDSGTPASGVAQVLVGATVATLNGSSWTVNNYSLNVGPNTIVIRATDIAGNSSNVTLNITRTQSDTVAPTLSITSPADNSTTSEASISVSGSASDTEGISQVTVNGINANYSSGNWTISNVALTIGVNTITVSATDTANNTTTRTVKVTRTPPPDTVAPVLNLAAPVNNTTTDEETILVSGTVTDAGEYASGIARVLVNGIQATVDAAGNWSTSVPLTVGQNSISVIATDNANNNASASVLITRTPPPDVTAPTITITSPAAGAVTPDATISVTGTAGDPGPYASGIKQVIVNGKVADYDANTHLWTVTGIPLTEGSNTIQAIAIDNAPNANQGQATSQVTLRTPDTTAPLLTITTPADHSDTFNSVVTVSGTADDRGLNAAGVKQVVVNGQVATYDTSTHVWSIDLGISEGINDIIVVASDNAPTPNTSQANIQVTRLHINPPVLTIVNPQDGAFMSVSSVTVAGKVSSNKPGMVITVKINGGNVPVTGGEFSAPLTLNDGDNQVTIIATDELDQTAQSTLNLTNDRTPPTVTLIGLPGTVEPGRSYPFSALAADDYGIASVDFMVDGKIIGTTATQPYLATLDVPTPMQAGRVITVTAVAHDRAGATSVATATTTTTGPAGVSGFVLDDTTGFVVPQARAYLNGQPVATTDAAGLYSFVSTTSPGLVRLSLSGYTPVERQYSSAAGSGVQLFDARLTPLGQATSINGSGVATGDQGRIQIQFANGSFATATDINVTSISPQGLINLLPFGWSPVPGAVVDVRGGNSLASAAQLSILQVTDLDQTTRLVLVRYDEAVHGWIVVAKDILAGANGSLSADLSSLGQYAFLVADTGTTAPPTQSVGQPLTGGLGADSSALDAATASAVANPLSVLYSPTAKTNISFVADAPSKLPSGVSVEATFDDTYILTLDRNPQLVDRPAQDFVLYSYPTATTEQPNRLGALFVARPVRTNYALAEILRANVHVEIRSGRLVEIGSLITDQGGVITAANGAQLEVPAQAVSNPESIFFNRIPNDQTGLSLPDGYQVVAAFDLTLSGMSLSKSAVISFPNVTGDNSRLVVVRVLTIGGQRGPKVVALAAESNGRIASFNAGDAIPAGVQLPGITTSGRYAVLRLTSPFGYLTGTVKDTANNLAANTRLSNDLTPFVDITDSAGAYTLIGAAGGNNQIGAAALGTDATASAVATLPTQDAVANHQLTLANVSLQIAVTPSNGTNNVIVTTPVTVTFNKPITTSSITGSSVRLTTTNGNPVVTTLTILAGNRSVVLTPAATLATSTTYKVVVSTSVRDMYGNALAAPFESSFSTSTTVTIQNRLRADQILIPYPGPDGLITISIPAQSVPTGSTITAINNSNGSTLTVTAGSGPLQVQLAANVGDDIEIIVRQPDGTEYRLKQAAFRRADGYTSVGPNGGAIVSADGQLILNVPAGAISGLAHLKLSAIAESEITTPRTGDMDPSLVPFAAGVKIETQGDFVNTQELHLDIPAPANATDGQPAMIMKPTQVHVEGAEGEGWEAITSGRVERGRIKSTSPPYIGISLPVQVAVISFFVFIPVRVRAITGIVFRQSNGGPTIGLPNAECSVFRNGQTVPTLIAKSHKDGRFAGFDPVFSNTDQVSVRCVLNGAGTATGVGAPYYGTELGLVSLQSIFASVSYPPLSPVVLPANLQIEATTLGLTGNQLDPLKTSGRLPVGSKIKIQVTATPRVQQINGRLIFNGAATRQLVWNNGSNQPGSSVYETEIEAAAEGSYSVIVNTYTIENNNATKATATFDFVALNNPNTRPSLPGVPQVLTSTPENKAKQIDVGTKIHLEFSEPVKNLVVGQTFMLNEAGNSSPIQGTLTTGGLPIDPGATNISSVDFEPTKPLKGDRDYLITVTTGVVDTEGNHLNQSSDPANPQGFSATFSTFQGIVLSPNAVEDSYRIAALGDYIATIKVSPGLLPSSYLTIYDAQQNSVAQLGQTFVPHRALGLALAEDNFVVNGQQRYSRIAVVTTTSVPNQTCPTNLWAYSIDDKNLVKPVLIAVVSMAIPQASVEIPGQVTIYNKRAYVGASPRGGAIVIDLEQAMNDFFQAAGGDPEGEKLKQRAITPQGGFDQEAQRQKAVYAGPQDVSPIFGISVIGQTVQTPAGVRQVPVAYVASNRQQLVSFNFDPTRDGVLGFFDENGDQRDDRILAMKDFAPSGLAVDVKAISGRQIAGRSTDLAFALNQSRLYIFDVTIPENPVQFTSHSFVDLGLAPTDIGRHLEIEDQYAYVMFDDKVAVIDCSDPENPYVSTTISGVGTGLRWMAVQEGFVFTLASDGGAGKPGVKISIGRAVGQVIAYGYEEPNKVCNNPVIVDQNTNKLAQPAAIFYQVFGHDVPKSSEVVIRRVRIVDDVRTEDIITTLTPTPGLSVENVTSGQALWNYGDQVDQSLLYTAEVVLDRGLGSEFRSKQTPIPFSRLIAYFPQQLAVKKNANGQQEGVFDYLLAGKASVTLTVDIGQNQAPQIMRLDGNGPSNARDFGQWREKFLLLPRQADGVYHFRFSAALKANPNVVDVVDGNLTLGTTSFDSRKPGSTVINGVEVNSGNLGLSETDLQIKGRGLSLIFARSYNSKDSNGFNTLGYGWTHNYQVTLEKYEEYDDNNKPTGKYAFRLIGGDGSGQIFREVKARGNELPAEEPYQGKLVKNPNGSFDFFTKGYVKHHFNQALDLTDPSASSLEYLGNLNYIEEPNGNQIKLRYDPRGRLDQVTDSSNRALYIEYELGETPLISITPAEPGNVTCATRGKFSILLKRLQQAQVGLAWRINKVTGPKGLTINYEYDVEGNLKKVTRLGSDEISRPTDAASWQYEYNPSPARLARYAHVISKIKSPNDGQQGNSRITTYEYDLSQQILTPVTKINQPAGVSIGFAYEYTNDHSAVTKATVTDGNGNPTVYTLDSHSRVIEVKGPRGDLTHLGWTLAGQINSIFDAESRSTVVGFDLNNNPSSETFTGLDGVKIQTITAYDKKFSKPIRFIDGRGNETTYTLDAAGNVTRIDLPTGRAITMEYLGNGDLSKKTDEYGFVTTYDYDNYGNAKTITRKTSGTSTVVTQNTFDERSRLTRVEDTLGPRMTNEYDALDRIVKQTSQDPANFRDELEVTITYLSEGQVKKMTRKGTGQEHTVNNFYDGLNRLKVMTEDISGLGNFSRTYGYDNNSNLLTETDRRGVTTTRTYDKLNYLTSIVYSGPFGASVPSWTATEIDKVGNPKQVVNQYNQLTKFEYDGLYRLKTTLLPEGYKEELTYDNGNNILTRTDRNGRLTEMKYDTVNRMTYTKDPAGRETTIIYDDATNTVTRRQVPQGLTHIVQSDSLGRPLKEETKFGTADYITTYSYNGRTITVTDPRGTTIVKNLSAFADVGRVTVNDASPAYVTEMRYTPFGALKSMTDPNSRTVTFGVDGLNRTMRASYPGGFSATWVYDGLGLVTQHTDKRGVLWEMSYDNTGRPLTKAVHEGSRTITIQTVSYDDANSKQTVTDANQHQTVTHFDGLRRIDRITNADGNSRSFTYDGMNLTEESDFFDQQTRRTKYTYDSIDRLKQITDRRGQLTLFTYDDTNGLTLTITDRRGNKMVESYDALGRLTKRTHAGQPVGSYEYDGNNNRTAVVDGVGNRTDFVIDKLNRVTSVRHAQGLQTETFTYDGVGNVVAYNDGQAADVTSTYDSLNRPLTRTDGQGNTTRSTYDGEGLLLSLIEPKGSQYQTTYEYNAQRSLTKVTDAKGGVWQLTYDDVQNVTSVKDALNRSVTYVYDELNRLRTTTQPLGKVSHCTYDKNSNLATSTDPNGQVATYAYDELDRLKTIEYPNTTAAGPRKYEYAYDSADNLTIVTETLDQVGARTYTRTYDERNRVTRATDPFSRSVSFTYDNENNLKSIEDGAFKRTFYDYDALNRLSRVYLPSTTWTVIYDWYANGLMKQVTYGNSATRAYTYDNANRLKSVVNTLNSQLSEEFAYTYDANSNRQTETRKQNNQAVRNINYTYDQLNRLTNATYTTPPADLTPPAPGTSRQVNEFAHVAGYVYDAVGNRSSESSQDQNTTITLTTDQIGNTTQSRSTQNGPLTTLNYTYNELNRLTTLSGRPGGDLTYDYDNNGNLLTIKQDTTIQSKFEYDVRNQLRRSYGAGNAELARYDYTFDRKRLQRIVAGTTWQYLYAGEQVVNEFAGSQLLNRYDVGASEIVRSELANEGTRYYFSDARGSITSLANLGAGVPNDFSFTAKYEYDAWGEALVTAGASYNAIGYTGQRLDPETGLMPLGNGERYYLPHIGRFLQQDSWTGVATMAQSMNRYAYANGNPLKFVDPSGHSSEYSNWDAAWDFGTGLAQGVAENTKVGFIASLIKEPIYQLADVATAAAARIEGIDAQFVHFSSQLAQEQQRQILAGVDPWTVANNGGKTVVKDAITTFAVMQTGSIGFFAMSSHGTYESMRAYGAGEITPQQFFNSLGHTVGNVMYMVYEHVEARRSAKASVAVEGRSSTKQGRMGIPQSKGTATEGVLKSMEIANTRMELRDSIQQSPRRHVLSFIGGNIEGVTLAKPKAVAKIHPWRDSPHLTDAEREAIDVVEGNGGWFAGNRGMHQQFRYGGPDLIGSVRSGERLTIIGHSDGYRIWTDSGALTGPEFADYLIMHGLQAGIEIELLSCHAGRYEDGFSVRLEEALRDGYYPKIKAATGTVRVNREGKPLVYRTVQNPDGTTTETQLPYEESWVWRGTGPFPDH